MVDKNFTVMIAGVAKSGMEAYVERFLKQLMEHSRVDKGCITYNIHQSIDNPCKRQLSDVIYPIQAIC